MTRARIDSSPAVAGNRVFVGSNDGRLYVLDITSGKVVWEYEDGGAIMSSPAIASGRVVFGSSDGRVVVPAELRRILGIRQGDLLDIRVEDGRLVLMKIDPECAICGRVDNLIELREKHVCKDCVREISLV